MHEGPDPFPYGDHAIIEIVYQDESLFRFKVNNNYYINIVRISNAIVMGLFRYTESERFTNEMTINFESQSARDARFWELINNPTEALMGFALQ